MSIFLYVAIVFFATFSYNFATQATTTTIQVNSTGDQALAAGATVCDTDLTDGDTVTCTLRAAIEFANSNANNGTVDEIIFTGLTGTGASTEINILSSLPAITEQLYIDGTDGDGDTLDVVIEGGNASNRDAFLFSGNDAHGSKIENLVIRGFDNYDIKVLNSERQNGTTYIFNNNYIGVNRDGSSIYTRTPQYYSTEYGIQVENSNYVTVQNSTITQEKAKLIYLHDSSYITIESSKLGVAADESLIAGDLSSFWAIHNDSSEYVTIHNNFIGGGFSTSYELVHLEHANNQTFTDNMVCINSANANTCNATDGLLIEGQSSNYISGITITGNQFDGEDEIDTTSGLINAIELNYVDNPNADDPALTNKFSDNKLGTINPLRSSGSDLLYLNYVKDTVFEKGSTGEFGTANNAIYILRSNGNTFKDFDITWEINPTPVSHYNRSAISLAADSYDNLIQNISIQGYDYGVYTWAASVDFNQFDRLLVKTHSNQQNDSGSFSQMPFTTHQGVLTSGTPTVNSTSESGGTYSVNLDVSANINGDSCFFTIYISDTEDLADAYLSDSSGEYNIAGTVNSGVCSLTNKEMLIPAEYTPVFANYVSAIVTEEYTSANLDNGTAVSDVKQSSTYSTAGVADLNVPIIVNSTGDEALASGAVNCDTDLTDGATQTCTLRAAIELANTAAATNQIKLSGITGSGTQTILVGSNLPDITKPVSIDGHDANGNKVGINGQNTVSDGLDISGDSAAPSTIENVSVYNFTFFNLSVNQSDSDSFANAHDIKNSYFGFEPDGITIQSSNGDVSSYSSDYVKFDNIVSTYLSCTYSENCQLTNSKLGTDKNASDISGSSVSPLGFREYSNTIYTGNNNVFGGTGAVYAGANKPTTSTISNNYYCVNSNEDELCRATSSAVSITLDNQKISVDFANNVIDGGTEAESPTHGLYIDGAGTSSNTPTLTIDNCDIGLVNGFHSESTASAIKIYDDVSGLQITNTDIGAARYAGIEFSSSTHENILISNVTITGDSGYNFSEYERGIKLAYSKNSTFSNVSISNYYYGLDPNNSTSYNWLDFDNVRIFDVNTAFRDPASYFDSTASQPIINSANSDQVNVDLAATVSEMDHDGIAGNDYASSCYFQVYIADTDVQGQAILTGATDNIDIPGTLNTGVSPPTCTATNVTLDIPDSYTFGANNYLVATVTEIIPTINWTYNSASRTASNVEQSSAYSAGAQMDLTSSASIALDDGDGYSQVDTTGNGVLDTDDVMFPYTTTVTLDASGSENAASYVWDLDTNVDSDSDGTPDNDTDATTESVTVNYGTSLINGAAAPQTLTNDIPVTVKLTVTGVSGDSATSSLELKPMNPIISGGIPSCTEAAEGGEYEAMLMDMSGVQPLSLFWDFDTLIDAEDDSNSATIWDGDGDTDNDIQSTSDFPIDRPSYSPGNYRIGLFHFDKLGHTGQSIFATHDLEVVSSIVAPTPSFSTAKNSLQVSFTDTTTGGCINNWTWDFDTDTDSNGDGVTDNDADSTEQNPVHTFSSNGTYTVKLTSTNSAGSNSIQSSVSVTDTSPTANFTTDTTNITTGDTVSFTNSSTGDLISGFSWDFDNDGTEDSTLQNPTYAYTGVAGVITASLTVTNPAGSDTHTVNINVSPKAEFTLDDGSGNPALEFDGTADPALPNEDLIVPQSQVVTLNVANALAGVIYTWDLNGSVDSDGDTSATNDSDATGQTVTIDYSTGTVNGVVNNDLANGTGDITIKLFASSGGLETSQSAIIRILKAAGSVSDTCIAKNSQITFSNTSTGFESSTYNFGDGNTKTFEENTTLSHTNTYTTPGNFTAVLSVFDNAAGDGQSVTNSHAIEVVAEIVEPTAQATYVKYTPDPADDFYAQFTDTSVGGCLTYAWDFDNDGVTDSTSQNPIYDFEGLGTFPVSLTVSNSAGSDTYSFDAVITEEGPEAAFTATPTSGQAPLTVNFVNDSTGLALYSKWDFENDGTFDSFLSDISKEFTTPGIYTVLLNVSNYLGSAQTTHDITVNPSSAFGFSPATGTTATNFTFTPSATVDSDTYNYAWDFDNNGTTDSVSPVATHTYTSSGSKQASLTVSLKSNGAVTSTTTSASFDVSTASSGSNSSASSSYSAPTKSTSTTTTTTDNSSTTTTNTTATETQAPSTTQTQTTIENTAITQVAEPPAVTVIQIPAVTQPVITAPQAVINTPETDTAETDTAETDTAETDTPETDTPEADTAETDTTEADTPEADTPETDTAETDTAETDTTETDTAETDTAETDSPEADTPLAETQVETVLDNLAGLLTGALFTTQPTEQSVQTQTPPAPVVQTQVVKVADEKTTTQLNQVFSQKPVVKISNQEKQSLVAASTTIKAEKKALAAKVIVDTQKQKQIIEKVVEKVKEKQQLQQDTKTIQAQDEDNNGVSDAVQELLGLSDQDVQVQKQVDPNLLEARTIYMNPENATKQVMIEMRESETYPTDNFIANGIVDKDVAKPGDIVEFYAQKNGENLYIGSSQLDINNNFSYINRAELEAGDYSVVAKLSEDNQQNSQQEVEFSVPVEIKIDPAAPQIPVTLESFAGQQSESLQSSANTVFAATQDVISGVVLNPGQPISLGLNVDSELARVVVNFNSVLYSASAITSSTNSELEVQAPLELAFEPGTSHTATAFAESIEDPTIKSKPIIIEFAIAKPEPWYTQPLGLSAIALMFVATAFIGITTRRKQAA